MSGEKTFAWKWANVFFAVCFSLIAIDTFILVYAQLKCDFSYAYVFNHISTSMETIYRVSALWAGQEGSFLLWALINTGTGCLFLRDLIIIGKKNKTALFGFLLINAVIILMTFLSGPFRVLVGFPSEGLGLNPALKDIWMVVHPPLIFISYSAMAVLFCLSLIDFTQDDKQQLFYIRKWILISWLFLGMGILSGSIWAYRSLGWGGYWAWDPIENAALVPWLLLTALVHCQRLSIYRMNN
jgi:cytochrome c-type biogenesis protein CcmF